VADKAAPDRMKFRLSIALPSPNFLLERN